MCSSLVSAVSARGTVQPHWAEQAKEQQEARHHCVCVCVVLLKVQDVAVAQQMWAALFSSVVSGRISSDEEAEVRR